jgi:hypothetical protein
MIFEKYVYSFSVWPVHDHGFSRNVFKLFESLLTRVEMEFTATEFLLFRADLERQGFTLREVERVPYHKPEAVL